ncbi:hypothetical protein [Evansella cellulosilytica]|uniref:Uncharacterized protein n=1 Tax=Evansella cellulosilytica (strain ATCC 21833 / DSM 2522 / FERM P-1141 / JCM 9156 / N-4) TaxID=649639 RepID=E6U1L7_EVAC2|nr:hypothetical protein [Evansella cellulosilytica]ADU30380.1 hypothetical protein Bcell_2119 [Evansella cellulosilytica DSM 2522]
MSNFPIKRVLVLCGFVLVIAIISIVSSISADSEDEPTVRSTTTQEIREEEQAKKMTEEEKVQFREESRELLLLLDDCFEAECDFQKASNKFNEYSDKWNDKLNYHNLDEMQINTNLIQIQSYLQSMRIFDSSVETDYVETFNDLAVKLRIDKRYVIE